MEKIIIKITPDMIEEPGNRKILPDNCLVTRAVQNAVPEAQEVSTGYEWTRFKIDGQVVSYKLPSEVTEIIHSYTRDEQVEPGEFTIVRD